MASRKDREGMTGFGGTRFAQGTRGLGDIRIKEMIEGGKKSKVLDLSSIDLSEVKIIGLEDFGILRKPKKKPGGLTFRTLGADGLEAISGLELKGQRSRATEAALPVQQTTGPVPAHPVRLTALVFGHPAAKAMKQILEAAGLLHVLSGDKINFYFAGYAEGEVPGAATFDAIRFATVKDDVEAHSRWEWSGDTDLLLVNAHTDGNLWAALDWSSVICLRLERALDDKAIDSCVSFFTRLIAFAQGDQGRNPAAKFSNERGKALVGPILWQALTFLLPKEFRKYADRARNFVVQDVTRK